MKISKFNLFLCTVLTLSFAACSNDDDNNSGGSTGKVENVNKNVVSGNLPSEITRLEFPKIETNGVTENVILVRKTADFGVNYSTCYDLSKKSARWCCYEVYKSNNVKNWTRKQWEGSTWMGKTWTGDPFQKDPDVDADLQAPVNNEYSKSGYDRGHIVASEDRIYSQDANGQTFFMTNMFPQVHSFNSGLWEDMEKQVRNFLTYDMSTQSSHENDTLYVCKGATIDDAEHIYGYTSPGNFIVPKFFFCAVLLKNSKGYQAIGFWFEHKADYPSSETVKSHVVNIKKLEELTGLDFFCNLPDDIEKRVESSAYDPNTIKNKWGF